MTTEEQGSLFTRFYRAKNDTTTTIAGTGLGLYLTKFFIEAHQGRVEVESKKDKGSTFRFFLPIQEASLIVSKGLIRKSFKSSYPQKLKENPDV